MGIKPKPDNKDNRERKRDGGGVNGNNFILAKSNYYGDAKSYNPTGLWTSKM